MAGEIQSTTACTTCTVRDAGVPPTPGIVRSMAFDRASARATTGWGSAGPNPGGYRDPAYIELNNVEGGTKFELVNLSKNPAATFGKDAITLDVTGRDLAARTASIYVTDKQMEDLDLKAGDIYLLRAKDGQGNVSGYVRGELEPDDWGNMQVNDIVNNAWTHVRGTQFQALDGEGVRKNLIARIVADGREPVVLEDRVTVETRAFSQPELDVVNALRANIASLKGTYGRDHFAKAEVKALADDARLPQALRDAFLTLAKDGALFDKVDDAAMMDKKDGLVGLVDLDAVLAGPARVALRGDFAMEPDAIMSIQNQRTGKSYVGTVRGDSTFSVLLDNMTAGDPLILRPVDHEGHAGKEVRFTYAPACKDGKAPVVSGLAARLGGVI